MEFASKGVCANCIAPGRAGGYIDGQTIAVDGGHTISFR